MSANGVPPLFPSPGQIAANIQAQGAAYAGWSAAQGAAYVPSREPTDDERAASRFEALHHRDAPNRLLYVIGALLAAGAEPVSELTEPWEYVRRPRSLFRKADVARGIKVVLPAHYPIGKHTVTVPGDRDGTVYPNIIGDVGVTLDGQPVVLASGRGQIVKEGWARGRVTFVGARTAVEALHQLAADHQVRLAEWSPSDPA